MPDQTKMVFDRLTDMVIDINSAIQLLQPGAAEIQVSSRFDVFGRCVVVLHDDERPLSREMTLGELMDWVEGAYWAVEVIMREHKGG